MNEARVEEMYRTEDAISERPLGTADLIRSRDLAAEDSDGISQAEPERAPLFPESELTKLKQHWQDTQAQFVDDPRSAVRRADELVASAMSRLAEVFASERERLEGDWDKGEEVSTEDLRLAFRRYRSFFDRLLSV